MNRTPRSIDEALSRARVFQGDYGEADLEAARHSIAGELHELRWVRFLSAPVPALEPPPALHEQAARDLRVLCRGIVRHHDAALHITAFDTAREPDGALTFACLLFLADKEEGAQFWWQFTAGAGNVTGALCLHLLHLLHSELRDAQHWAKQLRVLKRLDWSAYTPVDHDADLACVGSPLGPTVRYALPATDTVVPEAAVKDAVDDLVEAPADEDHGPIPQPSPALADNWETLITA
ncbi:hypothetical protein ACFYXF_44340 [Streptomyces sp. NPDC002680]|uniref:hypothetical protein n=1 Tax=Streptomyces sp. NPDC002680 TaxID=3364659 RepID=UPI00367961CC